MLEYMLRVYRISAVLLILVIASAAWASGVKFEIALSKTNLSIGEGAQLSLIFHGDRGAPQPPTPQLDGFSVNYGGSASRMSIINGSASSAVIYNYFIVPMKTGDFKIGPLTHQYNGKTYTSNELMLSVVDTSGAPPNPPPPASHGQQTPSKDSPKGINDRVFLTLKPSKPTVYVNEIFTVRVKLYIRDISVREVSFPLIADSGLSVSNFDKPVQSKETINGLTYDTVEFTAAAFSPTSANSLKLGPATLKCSILVKASRGNFPRGAFDDDFFNNFFDSARAEAIELKSETTAIKVMPLPDEGKPKGFKGAIGSFELSAAAEPAEVKTGDPVTLKMTVTGKGNFNTVTVPDKDDTTASLKYYDPQIKQDKHISKTFEQAVIPLSNSVQAIPEIVFSFFDPDKKSYQTVKKGPFPVTVTGAGTVGMAKISGPPQSPGETKPVEILGKDVVFIKERPGKVTRISKISNWQQMPYPMFLAFLLIPPMVYIGAVIHARRISRLRRDVKYARGLRAPKKAKLGLKTASALLETGSEQEFYDAVHKTIFDYLGDKLHMPPGEIMNDTIFSLLEQKGLETQTLKEIFKACDMTRYARGGLGKAEMQKTYQQIEDFIDKMEGTRF
ncbi:BatD family protein [Candidatus Magnetominusculus xianensis]|nr:BatD family protein [Candidatus Magnetominusculus xianensis]MBF0402583.1 protein BatD [Nitrospirota bacterium]